MTRTDEMLPGQQEQEAETGQTIKTGYSCRDSVQANIVILSLFVLANCLRSYIANCIQGNSLGVTSLDWNTGLDYYWTGFWTAHFTLFWALFVLYKLQQQHCAYVLSLCLTPKFGMLGNSYIILYCCWSIPGQSKLLLCEGRRLFPLQQLMWMSKRCPDLG